MLKRAFAAVFAAILLSAALALPSRAAEGGWACAAIAAGAAAEQGISGGGVRVAVIDSGVNPGDVAAAGVTLLSVLGDDGSDSLGHGTMVAGLISSVAPGAEIVSIKAFSDQNSATVGTIAEAVELAIKEGCGVINLSFGTARDSQSLHDAVIAARAAGILVVAASGNSASTSACYPATYGEALGVGAVKADKGIAPFSRRNSATRENTTLVAPGVGVYGGSYQGVTDSGSSFACAFVTGAAALLLEKDPSLKAAELEALLTEDCEDLGAAGFDNVYGWGLLRVDGALLGLEPSLGVPYFVTDGGGRSYVGISDGKGRCIAPEGKRLLFSRREPDSFSDVAGHWAEEEIDFASARGLLSGMGDGSFAPDAPMTRAMLVTILGRLCESSLGELSAGRTGTFVDCDYGSWYGKYVSWAAETGLVSGVDGSHFAPNDTVTREQLAAVLRNLAAWLGALPEREEELKYPDAALISPWALAGARFCQASGIVTGDENGNFDPEAPLTRAAAAAVLQRLVGCLLLRTAAASP